MNQADGDKQAIARGVCLARPGGTGTCGRRLKGGRCSKHGSHLYDPMTTPVKREKGK